MTPSDPAPESPTTAAPPWPQAAGGPLPWPTDPPSRPPYAGTPQVPDAGVTSASSFASPFAGPAPSPFPGHTPAPPTPPVRTPRFGLPTSADLPLLGWTPTDHVGPVTDDVPHRTHVRSIMANILITLVAAFYLFVRLVLEAPTETGRPIGPQLWFLVVIVPFVIGRFTLEVLRWRAFTYRLGDNRLVIDQGVLTRHLPKAEAVKPRQISVTD